MVSQACYRPATTASLSSCDDLRTYKLRGPRSGSDEASKQHRSQNEVEQAMGPWNKVAKITGGFISIFNRCKLKDATAGPKMPSVTDDVIDCPNKIIGCATASESY